MHLFKNPRFVSGAVSAAFVLSLFGGTAFAQASTLTSVQVQGITNLLQAFGADSGTIANVQAALKNQTTTTQTTTTPSVAGCNVLDNNLSLGATDQSTNGDVSQLQSFLGKDKSIYPEDAVTGYYGTLTLQAVQRWQAAHGIVSSGDPASTGFGHIGPRTRGEMDKEMETECEQGDSQHSSSGDSTEHSNASASSTSVQPITLSTVSVQPTSTSTPTPPTSTTPSPNPSPSLIPLPTTASDTVTMHFNPNSKYTVANPLHIAVYGDSTIFGWTYNGTGYVQSPQNTPTTLQNLLQQKYGGTVVVENRGVNGSTCPEWLWGTAPVTKSWVNEMAASDAQIVVMNVGINDAFLPASQESDTDFMYCYGQLVQNDISFPCNFTA